MTFQSTEIIITIYRGQKELCLFSLLPEETDTTGCPTIFTFVNTKKLLITFDYLLYHICYRTNINCNITVP